MGSISYKYMKKIIWILIVIVIVVFVVIKFNRPTPVEGSIKIGAALALTGDAAPWGEESLKSAQLAVDEINGKGGVDGKKLELVVEDMKSSTAGGVSAVSKLVNIDKVNAVMITWLDSYAGAESAVPKDMLMISQDAAIESVNDPVNHPNVFSLWYRTSSKAKVTIDEMKRSGIKNVYLVLQHDSYYTKLLEFLKAEATKQGTNIVGEDLLNSTDDARTVVTKISDRKPDSVFFGSYDDKLSVSFLKRYNEIVKAPIAVYGDEFIEQNLNNKSFSPAWLEGIKYYVPATLNPDFSSKFKAKFGHDPMFSDGTTYDTVYVIAKYLNDKPTVVSNYMKDTKFGTITYGEIGFDEIGGVVSSNAAIMIKKISGGISVKINN